MHSVYSTCYLFTKAQRADGLSADREGKMGIYNDANRITRNRSATKEKEKHVQEGKVDKRWKGKRKRGGKEEEEKSEDEEEEGEE